MRQLKMPVWPILDLSSFGLALGTVVGRIGDLAIVEHLGRATTAPWGYAIKAGYDVAPQHDGLECTGAADRICGVYHHVAAYDLIGAAILIGVLFLIYRRFKLHYGQLFWIWAAWYGVQRFVLDSLRVGSGDAQVGSMTWNQVSGFAAGRLRHRDAVLVRHPPAPGATAENEKLSQARRIQATRSPSLTRSDLRLSLSDYGSVCKRFSCYFYFAFTGPRSGMA